MVSSRYCRPRIYNKSFRHDIPKFADIEQDKYRKKALNIRNSIRYIENIKYVIQNKQHRHLRNYGETLVQITYQVNETLENGKKLERLNISFAIYGVLLALLFGFKNESFLKSTFTHLNINISLFNVFLILLSIILVIVIVINSIQSKKTSIQI